MSGTERRVSATEARVRFGELLDGVTTSHDVVFVERAGKEVAVVVSVERDEQLYGQLRGRESDHPSA
jgi:prevent-host-death family protein